MHIIDKVELACKMESKSCCVEATCFGLRQDRKARRNSVVCTYIFLLGVARTRAVVRGLPRKGRYNSPRGPRRTQTIPVGLYVLVFFALFWAFVPGVLRSALFLL